MSTGAQPARIPNWEPHASIAGHLRPLAQALVQGRAIVYVGAGASISSGLPGWGELLEKLKELADPILAGESEETKNYFKNLIKYSKNLEAADWLQSLFNDRIDQEVEQILADKKGSSRAKPSTIHQGIARLPFKVALTTNYDTLLEDALDEKVTFGYQDSDDIIKKLGAYDRPIVVKAHGTVGKKIILTSRHYRALMHGNRTFGELLKWLFTTNTCLFVGASLEDPDLMFLLNEAVTEYGDRFGPHYALIPQTDAPQRKIDIFLKNLRIQIIPLVESEEVKGDVRAGKDHWKTIAASQILRDLSGEVAVERLKSAAPNLPTSDERNFCLRIASETLLQQLCELTGSYRADLCLSKETTDIRLFGELRYLFSWPVIDETVRNQPVRPNSICGIAYYKTAADSGVYLRSRDDKKISAESGLVLYGDIQYVSGDPDVRSELAVPIAADGVRVGVLNLESRHVEAFTKAHLEVLLRFADKAGRLYSAAAERRRRSERLSERYIGRAYPDLFSLFEKLSWISSSLSAKDSGPLAFLVYQAEYMFGKLIPQGSQLTSGGYTGTPPDFNFGERPSLVASVFSAGKPETYFSAKDGIDAGKISKRFDPDLDLSGAVVAFPVLILGQIAGVVSIWRKHGQNGCLDGRFVELARRAFHLIANPGAHSRERSEESFVNLEVALDVVNLFGKSSVEARPAEDKALLDELGAEWRRAIGPSLRGLLNVLDEQNQRYLAEIGVPIPENWICPKRCRCWIKVHDKAAGKTPRYLLALQVSLDDESDRNLFQITEVKPPVAIASEPYPKFEENSQPAKTSRARPRPEQIKASIKETGPISEPLLYRENPHQSFLLSRIRADRFARVQRPVVLGEDILAAVLKKRSDRPWYVAPVYLADPHEWSQDSFQSRTEARTRTPEDRLVAYLTFDEGEGKASCDADASNEPDPSRSGLTGRWAMAQKTILHTLDFFSACLAEHCLERWS